MSGLFGGPKLPKDTSVQDLEAKRKKADAAAKDRFLTGQQKKAKFGRGSTVLSQDSEQETTLLGG